MAEHDRQIYGPVLATTARSTENGESIDYALVPSGKTEQDQYICIELSLSDEARMHIVDADGRGNKITKQWQPEPEQVAFWDGQESHKHMTWMMKNSHGTEYIRRSCKTEQNWQTYTRRGSDWKHEKDDDEPDRNRRIHRTPEVVREEH